MKSEIKVDSIKNFIDIEGLNTEDTIIRKQSSEGMAIDSDEERTFVATISDTSIDLDGDCVYSKGCDIRTIMKNPVVLWSHSHSTPPIGKIVGLNIGDNSIQAKIKMADTSMAKELWDLVKGGYLKTNSIGFVIKKAYIKGQREFNEFCSKTGLQVSDACSRIITEFTLVENSLCSIPANENALIQAISTKSIHLDDKLSKELGMDKVEIKEEKPVETPIVASNTTIEKPKEVEKPVEIPVIVVIPKVEQPLVDKPKEVVDEAPYEPEFVVLRVGDYMALAEDVKAYKSGKVIVL